jgi:hypothetical protein
VLQQPYVSPCFSNHSGTSNAYAESSYGSTRQGPWLQDDLHKRYIEAIKSGQGRRFIAAPVKVGKTQPCCITFRTQAWFASSCSSGSEPTRLENQVVEVEKRHPTWRAALHASISIPLANSRELCRQGGVSRRDVRSGASTDHRLRCMRRGQYGASQSGSKVEAARAITTMPFCRDYCFATAASAR